MESKNISFRIIYIMIIRKGRCNFCGALRGRGCFGSFGIVRKVEEDESGCWRVSGSQELWGQGSILFFGGSCRSIFVLLGFILMLRSVLSIVCLRVTPLC